MPITRITNVNVLDGSGFRKENSLTFVGSPGNILSSDSTPDILIDGTGCTMLPGLIDSKVDSGSSVDSLAMYVAHGATTAIDSSSSSAESQAMRLAAAQNPALPLYLASGSAIGPENNAGLVSTFNYSGMQTVKSVAEARRLVQSKILSNEADFIKVIVDQPGLGEDIVSAIVSETHKHGKIAMAQASQTASYRMAVDAGFDLLSPVPVDGELDADLIQLIVSKGIGITPTLSFLEKALPLWAVSHPEYRLSSALAAVTALSAAGARICAGSSANCCGELALPFGKSLHDELRLLARAGVSNEKLLRAVTSEPASLFSLSDRGMIESGLKADLIMVEGNPLEDIQTLSKIRSVWVAGVHRSE